MNFVADRCKRFADEIFVRERAVNLGGIKERDALLVGCTDDLDALIPGCGRAVVGADAHAPSSQLRDFQLSELSCLHFVCAFVVFHGLAQRCA